MPLALSLSRQGAAALSPHFAALLASGHENRRFCIASCFEAAGCRDGGGRGSPGGTGGSPPPRREEQQQLVVTGSEDHGVYLWGLQDRKVAQVLRGHADTVLAVGCHPAEARIASGGAGLDPTVRLWHAAAAAAAGPAAEGSGKGGGSERLE